MRKRLTILLLSLPLMLSAQTVETAELNCGARIQVTATPAPGYHFTEWSDGVTDNPRWLDMYEDSAVVAYFEQDCLRPEVPVVALYDQILTVDKAAINGKGFFPAESDITWYRVVGEQDAWGATKRDDELVFVGYSLTVAQAGSKTDAWYYAEAMVFAPDSLKLCSDTLRSTTWQFNGTQALGNTLHSKAYCYFTGTEVRVSGLPFGTTAVTMYDATGRTVATGCIQDMQCVFSPPPPGYYLIVITTRAGTTGLRYIHL